MTERRQHQDRRKLLPRKTGGRRITDPRPALDIRAELIQLSAAAKSQGKLRVEAVCLLAIAKLDELEAALISAHTNRQQAGTIRAASLTPERRREIAVDAAKRRWNAC